MKTIKKMKINKSKEKIKNLIKKTKKKALGENTLKVLVILKYLLILDY